MVASLWPTCHRGVFVIIENSKRFAVTDLEHFRLHKDFKNHSLSVRNKKQEEEGGMESSDMPQFC